VETTDSISFDEVNLPSKTLA